MAGENDFGQMSREDGYQVGHFGKDVIADIGGHAGKWYRIDVLTAAAFTAVTDESLRSGVLTGHSWPAGFTLFGKFTSIQLASGSIVAYRAQSWVAPT